MKIRAELTAKDSNSWTVQDDYKMQRFYVLWNKKSRLIAAIQGDWELRKYSSTKIEIDVTHYSTGSPRAHFYCNEIFVNGKDYLPTLMLQKLSKTK